MVNFTQKVSVPWRGNPADAHVRALIVVNPEPPRSVFLDLLDRIEDEPSWPFLPNGPILALDIGILLRLARLDAEDANAALCCPGLQLATDIFRPRCPRACPSAFRALQ